MYTILVDNINHSAGNSAGRSWPFSSIFRVGEPRMPSSESSGRKSYSESVPVFEQPFVIQLREVNHTKRDLLGTFIQNLYRENLFEEMLEEQEEVAAQRKQTQNMFQVLQQAVQVCCSLRHWKR
ncbi:hypothetical protein IFM89_018109 [Coptis chinensis]|uniref:Dynamin GTPase effector domain-containing protein n=1 Tax=Coptis chinensis TaxID=261450 RepID=A0A835IAP4_9MAGN|nr:hypothetical protein IFM89_018109 [Coptis chinensis]